MGEQITQAHRQTQIRRTITKKTKQAHMRQSGSSTSDASISVAMFKSSD
jgi:hypothetical protein